MAEIAPLRVQLIARTEFCPPPDVPWETDAHGGPALVEFAYTGKLELKGSTVVAIIRAAN